MNDTELASHLWSPSNYSSITLLPAFKFSSVLWRLHGMHFSSSISLLLMLLTWFSNQCASANTFGFPSFQLHIYKAKETQQ